MIKMNWDDIRIFVSVSKHKSFSLAAKNNQTTQATVSRRIQDFEQRIGFKLFERGQGGCELTPEGEGLLMCAKEMHSWADAFESKVKSINNTNRNVVITCGHMIARYLSANLSQLYCGIGDSNIELRVTPKQLSLEKFEADIALRNVRPESGQLKIRKVSANDFLDVYVYGRKKYYSNVTISDIGQLNGFNWAGYASSLEYLSSSKWLKNNINDKNIKYKLTCSSLLIEILQSSNVLAVMPQFVGNSSSQLVKVFGPVTELKSDLWLVRRSDQFDKLVQDIANNIETIFRGS